MSWNDADMEPWPWDAISAIATALATIVALGILARDIILRRQENQQRDKDARARRIIGLLDEVMTTVLGRLYVEGPRIAQQTADRANSQYRAELKLPILLAQIPDEYTILLRRSEAKHTIGIQPHEWEVGIDPWRHHEYWEEILPFPSELLAADILASIEALESGQPKKYPQPANSNHGA